MDKSQPATKEDLLDLEKRQDKKFAAKTDIKDLKLETKSIRGELLRVEEKVEYIQDEIKEIGADNKSMDTKLDRLQNTLDSLVGGIDELRVENTVGTHQTRELQVKVEDHEKRLRQVESSKQAA